MTEDSPRPTKEQLRRAAKELDRMRSEIYERENILQQYVCDVSQALGGVARLAGRLGDLADELSGVSALIKGRVDDTPDGPMISP